MSSVILNNLQALPSEPDDKIRSKSNLHIEKALTTPSGNVDSRIDLKANTSLIGANNGIASLDAAGKIPASQLTISAIEYNGSFGSAGSTTGGDVPATGTIGDQYICDTNGFVSANVGATVDDNDSVLWDGSSWNLSKNNNDVVSVFGRKGAVAAAAGDYSASGITNDSGVTGTTVKAALDANATDIATNATDIADKVSKSSTLSQGISGDLLGASGKRIASGSLSLSSESDHQLSDNLYYDGTNWALRDTAKPGSCLYFYASGVIDVYYAKASAGVVTTSKAIRFGIDGVIDGGADTTNILSGSVDGKAFGSSGNMFSSRSTVSAVSHHTLYNPNGLVCSIDTFGNNFRIKSSISGGLTEFRGVGNRRLLDIDNDNGVILGDTAHTDITSGIVDGSVFGPTGVIYSSRIGTTASSHKEFFNANGKVGSIVTTGSSTAFNTSSDPRLKNIIDKVDGLVMPDTEINSEFDAIKSACILFEWKSSGEKMIGFDAHKAVDVGSLTGFGTEGEGPRGLGIGDVYSTESVKVEVEVDKIDSNGNAVVDGDGNVVTETTLIDEDRALKVSPASVDQSKVVPVLLLKIDQLERRLAALEAL